MAKRIRYAFAVGGDKTPIPEPVQAGGEVSWIQGYGPDYSLNPTSDPDALRVERLFWNQFGFDLSGNIKRYQEVGFPDWIVAADNGGVAFPYEINAQIRHANAIWVALIAGATAEPGTDPAQWAEATPAVVTSLQKAANLSDLTNVGTARTNLGLGSAATFSASTFATAAAPVLTGLVSYTGAIRGNSAAVAALAIDWAATDFPTKSIAVNSVFTFTNLPAAGVAGVIIQTLTLTAGAIPTYPASVVWPDNTAPSWSNGVWEVGFKCVDGVIVRGKATRYAS